MQFILKIFIVSLLLTAPALAQNSAFHSGEVITEFGPIADVDADLPIPEGTKFKVTYDLTNASANGEMNRSFVTAARFLNMHHAAGVALEDMQLALIVHGSASLDLTKDQFYQVKNAGTQNANKKIISALIASGVEIIICGQSAAAHGINKDDLLPGVKMSLSAMTSHALYQQRGYTLNPF